MTSRRLKEEEEGEIFSSKILRGKPTRCRVAPSRPLKDCALCAFYCTVRPGVAGAIAHEPGARAALREVAIGDGQARWLGTATMMMVGALVQHC